MYTSGTTGVPKSVILTHENICSNVTEVRNIIPMMGAYERILSILPLSHIFEHKPILPSPKLAKWPRWKITSYLRIILQPIIFLFLKIFVKLEVKGVENLQNVKAPIIFMPNHLSYLDGIMITQSISLKYRYKLAFAAAQDVLYKFPFIIPKLAELIFNAFPFPRKELDNIKLGLDYMGELVDNDNSIVIFPKGKISRTGELLPFKNGAGLVAIEMARPVVPIKL